MRWWLALTFAGIAAVTALAVAQVFTARSESAIRERAQELVAGAAVAAAAQIEPDATIDDIQERAARFGESRGLALFVFAPDGSLVTPRRARGVTVSELPNVEALLETSLEGRRLVDSIDDGRLVTVAIPMQRDRAAALIAVASRSDLEDALGIVRDEIVSAALWATAIGALVGLVVALLITRRLTRIANTAADIEQGRFDRELRPRFNDELGALAGTIDRMRQRLRASFDRLEGERDRLRRLLEQLQEGVIAVDRDLAVEFTNSRARVLLGPGLAPDAPLPDPWPSFPLRETVRSLFDSGAAAHTIRMSPDSTRAYVVALLPPGPASHAAVVVITDVTEQERRERAEREFVTNAAHELRTPLAAIASAVEALQEGAKEVSADRDRFLGVVARQTDRLTRLVRALLTLARAQNRSESLSLEAVSIAPLVQEIERSAAGDSFEFDVCCENVTALAHRDLLQQALENLTANARQHAPGGAVKLRVAHAGQGKVRIDVQDDGPGMAPPEAERAFDRFYRSRGDGEGFGLGLAIVRQVVDVMRGELSIDSEVGRGTTVSIVLSTVDPGGCS
jgi:signal transduction histidine kinase